MLYGCQTATYHRFSSICNPLGISLDAYLCVQWPQHVVDPWCCPEEDTSLSSQSSPIKTLTICHTSLHRVIHKQEAQSTNQVCRCAALQDTSDSGIGSSQQSPTSNAVALHIAVVFQQTTAHTCHAQGQMHSTSSHMTAANTVRLPTWFAAWPRLIKFREHSVSCANTSASTACSRGRSTADTTKSISDICNHVAHGVYRVAVVLGG